MFKLAESGGDEAGLYCGHEGLFLGPIPLIARARGGYRLRAEDEIANLLVTAYGSVEEAKRLRPRLPLIQATLQDGAICRAMILAVQAQLGPIAPEGIVRLVQTEMLYKFNFNPDQPRDSHGRWTADGDGGSTGGSGTGDHPASPRSETSPSGPDQKPAQVAQNAPLDLSAHAWARMRERGITPDQVIDAINNGTRTTQSNGNIRCTGAGCVVVISPSGRIVTIY